LVAVILHGNHWLLPAQVEVGKRQAVDPQHRNLGLRLGQAGVDKK